MEEIIYKNKLIEKEYTKYHNKSLLGTNKQIIAIIYFK